MIEYAADATASTSRESYAYSRLGHRRPDAVGGRPSGRGEPRQGPRARGDRARVGDPQLRAAGAAARPRAGAAEGADDRGRHGDGRRGRRRSAATCGGAATRPAPRDRDREPTPCDGRLGDRARPTPVQRDGRLAGRRSAPTRRLLVKRDDLTGLALGGNKARKLARSGRRRDRRGRRLPRHRRRPPEQPRAHHRRGRDAGSASTATSCSAADRPDDRDGNLLLDELLGAHAALRPARRLLRASRPRSTALADRLRADGRTAVRDPRRRRVGDRRARRTSPRSRSCATQTRRRSRLDASSPTAPAARTPGCSPGSATRRPRGARRRRRHAARSRRRWSRELALDAARAARRRDRRTATVLVDHDHVGAGYGDLSDECLAAIRARGAAPRDSLLDPVYSGKAMAALLTRGPRRSHRRRTTRVVFWATGGSARAVRAPLRGRAHRTLTRTSGSRRTRSPSCSMRRRRSGVAAHLVRDGSAERHHDQQEQELLHGESLSA